MPATRQKRLEQILDELFRRDGYIEDGVSCSITVVPDSGTGELVGLAGKMTINIVDGEHSYEFEYTLAQSQ